MSDNSTTENIKDLTFEAALKELEEIVSQLDTGSIDLDKAVEAYEKKLKEAQLRIEKIEVDKNGDITTKVMDTE
jgi:exodeoxyribonuclease VII small subunit